MRRQEGTRALGGTRARREQEAGRTRWREPAGGRDGALAALGGNWRRGVPGRSGAGAELSLNQFKTRWRELFNRRAPFPARGAQAGPPAERCVRAERSLSPPRPLPLSHPCSAGRACDSQRPGTREKRQDSDFRFLGKGPYQTLPVIGVLSTAMRIGLGMSEVPWARAVASAACYKIAFFVEG